MASRKSSKSSRPKREKPGRAARAAAAEVEAVEEVKTGGMVLDDGIILTTFLLLAASLAMVVFALDAYPK